MDQQKQTVKIEADFAFTFKCPPELRRNQLDEGMYELIIAIEELGCSEELTAVVVLAGAQYDRIRRMKVKWDDLQSELLTAKEDAKMWKRQLDKEPTNA